MAKAKQRVSSEPFKPRKSYTGEYKFIDTHAHVTFPEFDKDRNETLARAWDAGMEFIITVGAGEGLEGNRGAVEFAEKELRVFATVGVHPHDAASIEKDWPAQIKSLALSRKVVALGEMGLDFYRNKAPREAQAAIFKKLLEMAHEIDLPIVIHSRDAHEEVFRIIKEVGVPKRKGVFHCFSGDVRFADKIVKEGFSISVPGIVTFENARDLQEVVAELPLEKIMLETDCPYLAPIPHRGKRNEPAFVPLIAEKIADIKALSVADVARITTLNAKRLFNLPGAELLPQIAYQIRNSLYLNITNSCTLACTFCPKHTDYEVKGHYLRLTHEPNIEEIFLAVGQPEKYDEVVFCGYGEPTKRLEVVKVIAQRMKTQGAKRIRLNTDGLANLIYARNVAAELEGLIDAVSISVNAPDAATYAKICPSKFGEKAYYEVINFVNECKRFIPEVTITAVALPGFDIPAMEKLARDLGVFLRIREYMNMG